MKYLLITMAVIIGIKTTYADNDTTDIDMKNNILFFKDPRVDILQKIYSRKAVDPNKKNIRVQVAQALSRDEIFNAKAQFSARYPGITTYVKYASPNFKLRVGDFETKPEAFKFMQQIKPYFPMSFVIEEKVNSDK
jgi:hypothetical protein